MVALLHAPSNRAFGKVMFDPLVFFYPILIWEIVGPNPYEKRYCSVVLSKFVKKTSQIQKQSRKAGQKDGLSS